MVDGKARIFGSGGTNPAIPTLARHQAAFLSCERRLSARPDNGLQQCNGIAIRLLFWATRRNGR